MGNQAYIQPGLMVLVVFAMTVIGLTRPGEHRTAPEFQLETFSTPDNGRIEGALFSKDQPRVVILLHGQVFDKESWYDFAVELQHVGVDAFCIDFRGYGNSTAPNPQEYRLDIVGAIEHMRNMGYRKIGLLGGSMGAGAMLDALGEATPPEVDRVAILAGAGPGIRSESIEKLFLVAEADPIRNRLFETFEQSASPKNIEILKGDRHAQHLFKGRQSKKLTATLVRFFAE